MSHSSTFPYFSNNSFNSVELTDGGTLPIYSFVGIIRSNQRKKNNEMKKKLYKSIKEKECNTIDYAMNSCKSKINQSNCGIFLYSAILFSIETSFWWKSFDKNLFQKKYFWLALFYWLDTIERWHNRKFIKATSVEGLIVHSICFLSTNIWWQVKSWSWSWSIK